MKITGQMSLRKVRAIMRTWTDDTPPPLRTQLLVLTSLERIKRLAAASQRDRLSEAVSAALRAWRPPRRRARVRPVGLSLAGVARELGVSRDVLDRVRSMGMFSGVVCGKRQRFTVDDVRAALLLRGWRPGEPMPALYSSDTKRGMQVLARREQRARGVLRCGCGVEVALDRVPPSRLKHGGFQCSDCRKPAKRAVDIRRRRMKVATQIEPVDIRVVARRDGWRCGICAGVVTKKTWSLDHIVPLSRGGAHTYANVVLAHHLCNSKRGAGRLPVQAPLFKLLP